MQQLFFPPFDYPTLSKSFFAELMQADSGEKNSLAYIKHVLPKKPLVREGIIQGIVIGGTNYITQTQQISDDGSVQLLQKETGELPIITEKQLLVDFFKAHFDNRAVAVGLNFGFPMQPVKGLHGAIDSKIIAGTKEHTFAGLIGESLGDLFRESIKKDIPVAVANDTICLILSGDGTEQGSMIAGTGFNLGIKKDDEEKTILINTEAGNFNKFEPSETLKIIDEQSEKPGTYLFEKMISGKYLATLFDTKANRLGIEHPTIHTSQELSELSNQTENKETNLLARALLERSAFLVAAALAGLYRFSVQKEIIKQIEPLTIISEGSLLWKGWQYYDNVYKQLELIGIAKEAIVIKHVQDSSIKGAIGLLTR